MIQCEFAYATLRKERRREIECVCVVKGGKTARETETARDEERQLRDGFVST